MGLSFGSRGGGSAQEFPEHGSRPEALENSAIGGAHDHRRAAKAVGLRLTAQQASKYVPVAGQAVAAALGYATLRYLGEQHLRDCVRVAHEAGLALPAPAAENHSLS